MIKMEQLTEKMDGLLLLEFRQTHWDMWEAFCKEKGYEPTIVEPELIAEGIWKIGERSYEMLSSKGDKRYNINVKSLQDMTCNCPAFTYKGQGKICKHCIMLADVLIEKEFDKHEAKENGVDER